MTGNSGISIGPDKYITWIDTNAPAEDLYDIDELLKPSWPFFECLETYCVAGCCGSPLVRVCNADAPDGRL